MAWTNSPARIFHGTTRTHAGAILAKGINPSLSRPMADFGQGFYVTSDLHQAQQWANQKVRNLPTHMSDDAAVIEFEMDRDQLSNASGHLAFLIADAAFHDFVLFNRLGGAAHGRMGGKSYDVVYGPVAAFPQTLTYANCDQVCFVAGGSAHNSLTTSLSKVSYGNPFFP